MTEIAVETLQEELSHYLERAQKGERILIHDRGHSIAILTPAEPSEPSTVFERARRLVDRGVASWSGGKPGGPGERPKVKGKSASDIVLEDRR